MDLSQLPIEELEKQVSAKKAWLQEIIDFVTEVTVKHGKCLEYKEYTNHTRSKHELRDIQGFSFKTDGSYTMFGGENLHIWYRPPSWKRKPSEEVLELEWWNEIHVRKCVNEKLWVPALKRLMKNKEKVFPTSKQKEQQEKQVEKKKQDERHEAVRRKELLEQAQKMGM